MKIIFSIYLLFLINYLSVNAASIWARGCGFVGNDLTNARVEEEDCGPLCEDTPGCTHFTWSYKRGGTCWMKYGPVSRLDAVRAPINLTCGVIDDWQESQPSLDIGQTPNRDLLDPIFVSRGERAINWPAGQNWMMGCDFFGNDLSNVQIRGEDCGQKCATTLGCTHFTWTNYLRGTCWMKKGPISKENAIRADPGFVCGVLEQPPSNQGPTANGVLTTRHAATEIGSCELPAADYSLNTPVALGDIPSLGSLRFKPSLCGQVLSVDCGRGPLNIIVTNTNLGGGLDLYASSWSIATANKPPGQAFCSVSLTNKSSFKSNQPACYYATGETNNEFYHKLGLLNTGGRLVEKAFLDGRQGFRDGNNPYFVFHFRATKDKQLSFVFSDGGTFNMILSDCRSGANKQIWS